MENAGKGMRNNFASRLPRIVAAAGLRRRLRVVVRARQLLTIGEMLTGRPLLVFRDCHGAELRAAQRLLVAATRSRP